MTPYEELVSYILPEEIFESFEVKKTEVKVEGTERVMYIHLDEFDLAPVVDVELFPNVFHDVTKIKDGDSIYSLLASPDTLFEIFKKDVRSIPWIPDTIKVEEPCWLITLARQVGGRKE